MKMNVSRLLRRKTAWAIGIYRQDRVTLPPEGQPSLLMQSRKLVRGPRHIHTRADPFLHVQDDRLYVLYETQSADDYGKIEAAQIVGDKLVSLGLILEEPFHLSYPAIFEHDEIVYLMPECQESGELRLYRFDEFPRRPVFVRTLMTGKFADPSPYMVGETLFIFATTSNGLELFYTDDWIDGQLQAHPMNPIVTGARSERCGGTPFLIDGVLVRPAQNCQNLYGENLGLMRIEQLTKETYSETPYRSDIFKKDLPWNKEGGHHVSVAAYEDEVIVAVDGQAYDYYFHKLVTRAWMMATRRRRG